MPKNTLKELNILSEMVSNQHELSDADALTAHLIGDTPTLDRYDRMADEGVNTPWPDRFDHNEQGLHNTEDDFQCCDVGGEHNPAQAQATELPANLSPASVFMAITHNNGITDKLPASWETSFDVWWDYTQGNLALIRIAVDAVAYVASTGANVPDLIAYMDAAIMDITQWTNAGDDEQWNVHGFEARALGNILSGLEQLDPGVYTHPLHQLAHTALTNAEERTVTGVYGWLCRTGAMGHAAAPYTLQQLQHLAEGGTI